MRKSKRIVKPILKFSMKKDIFAHYLKYIYRHSQVFQPPLNTLALLCLYSPCPFLSSNFQLCLVSWVPLLIHHTFQPSYLYHCSLQLLYFIDFLFILSCPKLITVFQEGPHQGYVWRNYYLCSLASNSAPHPSMVFASLCYSLSL